MNADKRSKGLDDLREKLLKIAGDIAERGNANLTRLTVLKKWFGSPGRLPPFAIWVARRAISGKGKTGVEATELFRQARALLARVDPYAPKVNRKSAKALHDRLQTFQNEYKNQQWGPVRIIHNWDIVLVEQALAIYLWYPPAALHIVRGDAREKSSRNFHSASAPASPRFRRWQGTLPKSSPLPQPSPPTGYAGWRIRRCRCGRR